MQLAIDSSTDTASLAIARGNEVLAELTWRCGQNHSVELMPAVHYLLESRSVSPGGLVGIAVALGPGAFSALRVGISAAKGMALGLGLPLVGVGTLEAEAYAYADLGLPVCALLGAGRGEVAAALFKETRGTWRCLREPAILPP